MARWGPWCSSYKLSEEQFRGARFARHPAKYLKGNLELLQLTQPEVIEEIHTHYLEAGADIIETNTFSATTIGQHDFLFAGQPPNGRKDAEFFHQVVDDKELGALVHEMNLAAAKLARAAVDRVANQTGQARFVAGSLGPLPVTASLSPDVNDPGFRAVTFDQMRRAYAEQVRGLLEGGVDVLLRRDDFRHLERKGGDLRHRWRFSRNAGARCRCWFPARSPTFPDEHLPVRRSVRFSPPSCTPSRWWSD